MPNTRLFWVLFPHILANVSLYFKAFLKELIKMHSDVPSALLFEVDPIHGKTKSRVNISLPPGFDHSDVFKFLHILQTKETFPLITMINQGLSMHKIFTFADYFIVDGFHQVFYSYNFRNLTFTTEYLQPLITYYGFNHPTTYKFIIKLSTMYYTPPYVLANLLVSPNAYDRVGRFQISPIVICLNKYRNRGTDIYRKDQTVYHCFNCDKRETGRDPPLYNPLIRHKKFPLFPECCGQHMHVLQKFSWGRIKFIDCSWCNYQCRYPAKKLYQFYCIRRIKMNPCPPEILLCYNILESELTH